MLLKGVHCTIAQNIIMRTKKYILIIFVYQKALIPTFITNIFTTEYPLRICITRKRIPKVILYQKKGVQNAGNKDF